MEHKADVGCDGAGIESLCWDCMRAGWFILCTMPQRVPTGATVSEVVDNGKAFKIIVSCPYYWAEKERKLDNEKRGNADNWGYSYNQG